MASIKKGSLTRYASPSRKKHARQMPAAAQTARNRIVETAARLFESQGYAATGINQIIAESKTAKASFYDYFASKELLGEEYLERYGTHHIALIRLLIQRSATPADFLSAWVRLIRRQLREKKLYGCPMANLRAQIGNDSPLLENKVRELTRNTIAVLSDYIENSGIARGSEATLVARRVFAAYEGAIHIWQLTGDAGALDDIAIIAGKIMQRD